jgi:hypothetical protein
VNKKEVPYIAVLLIVIITVFSSPENSLYSDVIRDTKIIEANNYEFSVKISESGARIAQGNDIFRVSKGECSEYRNFKFCIGMPTKVHDIYKVPLVITQKQGLTLSKTIDKTELSVGEKVYVSIHLRNDGNIAIESTHLKDRYPPQLEVTILEDTCWLRDNVVAWGGTLKPDETMKCRYSLTAQATGEYMTEAEVVYYDRTENKISSGKTKISIS